MTFPDETKNRSNRFVPRETTALSEAPRENVPDQIVVKTACDEGAASSPEPSEPQPIIKASIENGMHFSTSNFIGSDSRAVTTLSALPISIASRAHKHVFRVPLSLLSYEPIFAQPGETQENRLHIRTNVRTFVRIDRTMNRLSRSRLRLRNKEQRESIEIASYDIPEAPGADSVGIDGRAGIARCSRPSRHCRRH